MIWRCDLLPQYKAYEPEILRAMRRVLDSGRYILADEVKAFEAEFSAYIGMPHGVSVANATDGLTLSLAALGIGRGDEVITTPFTAIPTVSAIIDSGAIPVFADIDPATCLIDIDAVRPLINRKTKAIMPVHLFGNVCDIPKLRSLMGKKIRIIEDASQAHGSLLNGRKAGSFGDLGVFSFYPTKNLGGYGDGGMVVTGDARLADRLRRIRMYGMVDKDHISEDGVNSRLDELQAAVLRVKLRHLDKMNEVRNRIARRYVAELRGDLFEHQVIPQSVVSNYHVFVARFKGDRDAFVAYMDGEGIQTNVYYPLPVHLQKAVKRLGYRKGDLPRAEGLCGEVVALPMYPELKETVLTRIIRAINRFVPTGSSR